MLKIECSCGERYEFKQNTIFNRNRNQCPNCDKPFLATDD